MSAGRLNVLLGIALAVVLVFAIQSSAVAKSCGGGVTTKGGLDCAKGTRIAKEYKKTHKKHIQGYICKAGKSRGTCTLNTKSVSFTL